MLSIVRAFFVCSHLQSGAIFRYLRSEIQPTYMYHLDKLPIRQWAEEDRPREKLVLKGKASLSEAELIAILIGSGTTNISAVDLARSILVANQNDLNKLAKLSIDELKQFNGIGEAKAITIISALELGRRRKSNDGQEISSLNSSKAVYDYLKPFMMDLDHEQCWVLFMNNKNTVIRREIVGIGGISGTVVDTRIIFKKAINMLATGIILAHNHPSGVAKPSEVDRRLTKRLKEAGVILDIKVLDHLIFANDEYYSFADDE
jgi:DNA repair protein RadC